ncbi:hypothetical protein OS493_013074 [Desmophyllum pertusum]|uniref:Uncharacterized protein n=1 Tax=Desmophyllum pertusum TaxID=174260 RepID=A0A9X0CMJ4_9CNID|nr:hypothetical protein OS493_013074 [Desmophyllum pertusum]
MQHKILLLVALTVFAIQGIRNQTSFPLEELRGVLKKVADQLRSFPLYILARGDEAIAAYQRALELGKTPDKRVKVLLIGQDRVGKTSLGRSLKGELFRKDESSTEVVQMDMPLKHVGTKPWKNSTEEQEMTAFHHKCALYISDHLLTAFSKGEALGKEEMVEKMAIMSGLSIDDELHEPQERKTATKVFKFLVL